MIARFGKYTVDRLLGEGAFGEVYLASDPHVGQPVAIKRLRAKGDSGLLKRFKEEIRVTARLRHKNIVIIHASDEQDGDPYLVMEYLEGQTLRAAIRDHAALTLLEKVRIMAQVAEGLAYAHSKGVVHRDVKPENIMLLLDGGVKIMDFGIALAPNRDTAISSTLSIPCTPVYLSPERIEGHKANEQSDIFSYGDVYYELLTGAHPFESFKSDWEALGRGIKTYEPPSVGRVVPGCPGELETLVHCALAKDPQFRYRTFDELRLDNEAILVDLAHEQVVEILRIIPALLEAGDAPGALRRANEAYQLEPGNREVRRLREQINRALHKAEVQQQVAKLMAEAEQQIGERNFAKAVQSLQSAVRLDTTDVHAGQRLSEAQALLEGSLEANRLVSEARLRQQSGLWQEALALLESALRSDPHHPDAGRLYARIQNQQRLQDALQAASEHRAAKRFVEALAALAGIEAEQPGNAEVAELRGRIETEQRGENFNVLLAAARKAMQSGELEEVIRRVNELALNFPGEPGAAAVLPSLREWIGAQTRLKEIARYRSVAGSLLEEKRFREALALLAEALEKFPGDPGLKRQNETARSLEHAAAVDLALQNAIALRETGDLRVVLAAIRQARRELGEERALVDFSRQIETEIEYQRYGAGLQELLGSVRQLMADGRHSEAMQRLERAQEYRDEAEVRALLETARVEAAMEQEHSQAAQALAASAGFQAQGDWVRALSVVEDAASRHPHSADLKACVERLRARRKAVESQRGIIRQAIQSGDWIRADFLLREAAANFPQDTTFDDLADQVNHLAARKKYEAALQEAEACRAAHDWRKAQELLHALVEQNPPDSRAQRMLREIEEQCAADQRKTEIMRLDTDIRERVQQEDLRLAAAELREARTRYPNEALWDSLETEILTRQSARREAEMSVMAANARRLLQDGLGRVLNPHAEPAARYSILPIWEVLEQVQAQLSDARLKYPGERLWDTLQDEFTSRKRELERAIAGGVRSADREQLGGYSADLSSARARYPGEAFWETLATEIEGRRRGLARLPVATETPKMAPAPELTNKRLLTPQRLAVALALIAIVFAAISYKAWRGARKESPPAVITATAPHERPPAIVAPQPQPPAQEQVTPPEPQPAPKAPRNRPEPRPAQPVVSQPRPPLVKAQPQPAAPVPRLPEPPGVAPGQTVQAPASPLPATSLPTVQAPPPPPAPAAVTPQPVPKPDLQAALDANAKGMVLYKQGSYNEAINAFSEAVRILPYYAIAFFNRGAAYYMLGQFQNAISDFDRAIALDPHLQKASIQRQEALNKLASGVHWASKDVSQPVIVNWKKPRFTKAEYHAGETASVLLQFVVGENGRAKSFKVLKSAGRAFDERAVAAIAAAKFKPGQMSGKPVAVEATMEVQFDPP